MHQFLLNLSLSILYSLARHPPLRQALLVSLPQWQSLTPPNPAVSLKYLQLSKAINE